MCSKNAGRRPRQAHDGSQLVCEAKASYEALGGGAQPSIRGYLREVPWEVERAPVWNTGSLRRGMDIYPPSKHTFRVAN